MPIEAKEAAPLQENPYMPPGPKPLVFEQWRGVNTLTSRAGVPDEQAWWIDGIFPISDRKARTLPGVGPLIYTASVTTQIVCFFFGNIGATPYSILFLSDGSVVAVNTNSMAATTILPAGTIHDPNILNVGVNQWGSQYILIVANQTNGYWAWNGTLLFTAGTISTVVTITNTGAGYQTAPIPVVLGGRGTGTSLVASINSAGQVISISIVNPGTGYLANDLVSISFIGSPTGGTGASLTSGSIVKNTTGAGADFTLTGVNVVGGGSGYSNPTIIFTDGVNMFVPPVGVAIVSGGQIVGVSLTSPGNFGTTTPVPTITATEVGATASATLTLFPYGIQGTDLEVYAGHVWVINGALVQLSAPGAFDNFATSAGGGNFTSNDSSLRIGYTRVIANNGFLYLVGDSSAQYISGVQTSGSVATTTFNKQILDPQVGSPYPASVQVQGRNVMFANSYGVHVIAGAQASKASEMLDGVFSTVPNFAGTQISAATATVFGKKVWMELTRIKDPVTNNVENKLLIWDGKQWFASLQDVALTFIKHQEINSVLTAYGTDGTSLYPLFQQASSNFTKRMSSKMFDAPGGYQFSKAAGRFWMLGEFNATVPASIRLILENEVADQPGKPNAAHYTLTSPTFSIPVVNALSATIPAVNNAPATIPVISLDQGLFATAPQAVGQVGVLTGFTLETDDGDLTFVSAQLAEEIVGYRG